MSCEVYNSEWYQVWGLDRTTTGLAATYFKNADFSGGSVSRTETAINFNWGDRSPDATVPVEKFSAVFTGKIKPDIASGSDNYLFRIVADGGVRVWVNDHLMLNHWQDAPPAQGDANLDGIVDNLDFAILYQHYGQTGGWEKGDFNGDNQINFIDFQILELGYGHSQQPVQVDSEAAISLTANQQYSIRVEYFDASLFASLKLFWSHGGSGFTFVPQSALVPTGFTPIPARPVIATTSPQASVRQGDTFNYDLHAYDPDGGNVTYTLISPDINQLPADVTWTPRTDGTATVSYAPISGTEDPIPVVVEVTDDEGQKTRQGFTLMPSPKTAPTISTVPNATIYTGETYTPTAQLLNPGYGGDAVVFALSAPGSGSVPSWITINSSTGQITAAPQVGDDRPQPYRLEVQATNTHGAVAIQDFDLTIRTDRKPTVRMTVSNTTVAPGQSLTFHVTATDGRGTPNLSLTVNNTVLTVNGNGDATWIPTSANLGDVDAFATAIDPVSALQDNSVPIKIRVYDPSASAGTQRLYVPEDATFYLNKIPVEISRIYDTADAATALDFGKGWHLDLGIQGVLKGEFDQLDHAGQHLVVTLPNGKPEGFTFRPRFIGRDQSLSEDAFVPDFVPDPGVTSTLSAREDDGSGNAEKLYRLDGASDYTLVDQFTEFQPDEFSLTTTSGFTYHITSAANIDTVTDAIGNRVDFSNASSGVIRGFDTNSTEADINITRPSGQITQIQQGGRTISYSYDPTTGDLKTVTDAVSGFPSDTWTTQYTYNSGSQLKLITRGANTALSVTYGAGAAITAVKDGLNRDVPVLTAASQSDLKTSSHSLDDGTLLVRTFVQDGNGNPVTEIDPDGNRIDRTFVNGRVATYTEPYPTGDAIRMSQLDYTGDGWSNITRETDPAGRSTIATWFDDKLLTRIDSLGNTTTNVIASSDDHKTLASTDEQGNQTTYVYWNSNDPLVNGRLKSVISTTGTVSYTYPTDSIITSTDSASGKTTSTFFDADGATTGTQTTDRNGTVLADRTGRLTSLQSQGKTFTFSPDPNGNPILDSGPAGGTQYTYDSRGRLISTSTPSTPSSFSTARVITVFDVLGRVTSTTDPLGVRTDSSFDRADHLIKTIFPDSTPANSADNPFTQTAYDHSGRQQSTIDEYGNTTTYLYDTANHLIQTTYPGGSTSENVYDSGGNEILTIDRHLSGGVIVGMRKYYDAAGHVVRTDRVQNVVVAITSENGVSRTKIQSEGTVVATSATVFNFVGRWSMVSDSHAPDDPANGTRTFYDAAGRVIRTERVRNVVISISTAGEVSQSQLISDGGVISQSLNVYDANGNISLSVGADGQTIRSVVDSATRQVLDSYDSLGGNTHFTYVDGREDTQTDARDQITHSAYYQDGTLQKTTYADGSYVKYTYDLDGRKLTETLGTPANVERTTTYSYTDTSGNPDPRGNIDSVTLPAVTDPRSNTAVGPVYRYTWDAHGNLQDMVDPFARTSSDTVVTYDAQGRKHVTHHFATGPSETDVDNLLGRLDQHVDFKGQATKYTYDAFGRVSSTDIYAVGKVPGTDSPNETITNLYDALSRLTQVTDDYFDGSPRVTTYKYDQDGRQIQVDSPEGMIHYEYDTATGRLIETLTGIDFSLPIHEYQRNHSTSDTHYAYDELGRLKTVSLTRQAGNALAQPRQASYVYDEVGNRIEENLSNGVSTFNTYNSIDELTNVTTRRGNIVLSSYAYTYGINARREGATETRLETNGTTSTRTIVWGYDNLDRLTSEAVTSSLSGQSYTKTFIVDLVGNRLRQTTAVTGQPTQQVDYYYDNDTNNLDATIPLGNNLLTREVGTIGGAADYQVVYHYDDNGSMDSKTRTGSAAETDTYVYDKQNRLQSAIAGVTTTYGYDTRGNRTVKTVGGQQTHYLVDNNNPTGVAQVLAESSLAAGTPSVSYFVGARVVAQNASGVTSFLTGDAEGSTRLLTDPVGEAQSRYDFDAFGNTIASSGSITTNVLYTGQQFDTGLKSYYLRSRYYDPAYGRFPTADSFGGDIASPQSLHKYTYASNNPVNHFDPSGMADSLINVNLWAGLNAVIDSFLIPAVSAIRAFALSVVGLAEAYSAFAYTFASLTAVGGAGYLVYTQVLSDPTLLLKITNAQRAASKAIRTTMSNLLSGYGPLHVVFGSLPFPATPAIYSLDSAAQGVNPNWIILNYMANPIAAAANRARAIGRFLLANPRYKAGGLLVSLDEYPYASTSESTKGNSWVTPAPIWEQALQGGLLGAFYRWQLKGIPGPFAVILVP